MKKEENTTINAANAANELIIGETYIVKVTGFTYVRDYAMIRGTINGISVGIIIGDKLAFPMSDMFQLKAAEGIRAKYIQDKVSNGTLYQQFRLVEILF